MKKTHFAKSATVVLTFAAMLGLGACQKTPPPVNEPTSETATETGTETATEIIDETVNETTGDFDPTFLEMGQNIAKSRCGFCHNTTATGKSPRSDAPPLRTVLKQYNPDALADDFREHIHVGHPDMPDFDFTVKQTEGLLAYLTSIQEKKDTAE